jgi:hypothetical protein
MTRQPETLLLMGLIGEGSSVPSDQTERILELASRNKVALEAMRRLGIKGNVREEQELKLARFMRASAGVVSKLSDTNYAVIKFFKPVAYVPSDLDLLVASSDSPKVLRILRALGFEYIVSEPNCVTMRRDIQVDVYTNPDFMNLKYLPGNSLLEHTTDADIEGTSAKRLSAEAEAVLICAHSVYKEQLITMSDYFSLKDSFSPSSIEIGRSLKVEEAVNFCLSVSRSFESGLVEAPFRVSLPIFARIFLLKLLQDSNTRRGAGDFLRRLGDRRLAGLLLSRLQRETY